MSPKITVLLTVYNRESISKTIESILSQTYQDFELLIIDNASTDKTQYIIKSYSDKRIRLYINEKNMGQTYSLNRGLALARGEYIARIDADDICLPKRLEIQADFLDKNPEFGFCGSWVRYITDNDILTVTMKMPTSDTSLRAMQVFACGMYHPSAMYRKSIVKSNNLTYDSKIVISEDYELWRKLLIYSKGLNIPQILIYYRKGDNDSVKHADLMFKEALEIRKNIYINDFSENSALLSNLLKVLDIESKHTKTLLETIFLIKVLKKACFYKYNTRIMNDKILRFHFLMHVYTVTIFYNDAVWARFVNYTYKKLKIIFYKIKGRKKI